jgi:hypothetical protein
MQQPTPDSVNLVQTFMDDEREPLVKYLALMVGSVMDHNYQAVLGLIEEHRGGFEAAGAGEILADLELELRSVFEPFLNAEDEQGK